MIVVVVAELMTVVVRALKTVVGAVHLKLLRGLHLWLELARSRPVSELLRTLPLRARNLRVLLLKVKRTLDGERCCVLVSGLCLHYYRLQE